MLSSEKHGWDFQMNSSSWKSRCLALTLVLALIAGWRYKWLHSESQLFESKKTGIRIFGALNSYRQQYGFYPVNLKALVPKFLKSVENPSYGTQKWQYWVTSGGDSASLKFHGIETFF